MAIIEIMVQPNSKKNEVIVNEDGTIKVRITEKPIEGRANRALIKYLKKLLKAKVEILKGEKSEKKILNIEGLEREEILKKLKKC